MTPDAQDSSIPKLLNLIQTKKKYVPKLLNLIQTKKIYKKERKEKASNVDSHQSIQTTAVMRPRANENSRTKHMEFSFHLNWGAKKILHATKQQIIILIILLQQIHLSVRLKI